MPSRSGAAIAMLRFDYSGTGSSSGEFERGTLAMWLEEALAAIDRLTEGPLILVGSSMGGWIALHVALRRPDGSEAVIGNRRCARFYRMGFHRRPKGRAAGEWALEEPNPYGPERKSSPATSGSPASN